MANASRDKNFIPTLLGVSSVDLETPTTAAVDPVTHRVLVDASSSGASIASHFQTDSYSSTNGQTTFVSSQTVISTIYLSVNGSIQTPSTDYSIIGGQAVLNSGIPSGCAVIWVYIY